MKKILLLSLFTILITIVNAQTVSYPFVSGPSFKSFDAGPAEAGAGWNYIWFNDSTWNYSFNGAGAQQGGGACAGANSSSWGGGDTIIWSSPTSLAPDTGCFRKVFKLPHCGQITAATFSVLGDDFYLAYINGNFLGTNPTDGIGVVYNLDSTQLSWLSGSCTNIFAFEVVNSAPYCAELDITGSITVDTMGGCPEIKCSTTGVDQIENDLISIYPNPANDLITVSISDRSSGCSATLFDMVGNKILSKQTIDTHFEIDMTHIAAGIYIMQLTDSDGRVSSKKITKQ